MRNAPPSSPGHSPPGAEPLGTEPLGTDDDPGWEDADSDNDGLPDIFATGPSDVSWSPRVEYVGGRFWRNRGGFQFEERTEAVRCLPAVHLSPRGWYRL